MEYASGVPEAQSAPLSFSEGSHIEKKRYSKIPSIFFQSLKGGALAQQVSWTLVSW